MEAAKEDRMSSLLLKKLWIVALIGTLSGVALAQNAANASAPKAQKAAKAEPAPTAETAPAPVPVPAPPPAENTLDVCGDGADNDGDGHVDCDDQDCEIYAICVQTSQTPEPEQPAAVASLPEAAPVVIAEFGHLCTDGIDNNQDGVTDCHEPSCQSTGYCRKMMYERPESPDKAPGLFFNFGIGVALPNFRVPTMETTWISDGNDEYQVPFDPDMGVMLDFEVGYLFLKFMGAGLAFKSAFTGASNRSLHFDTSDDPDLYKYTANKYYGNLGGFVRFQWPFKRVTPYVNLQVGYSVAQATWNVYEPENTWDEIDDAESHNNDETYLHGEQTQIRTDRERHFTFAVEPGVDITVVPKLFTVGLKAWLPVIANEHSSYDNTGVLISFGFTPMWREPLQLKPEFAAAK
jgi:hypothetical protein